MQMRTVCGTILAACAALFIDMVVAVSQAAEWSPYWKNSVVVSPESVKASIYRRGENSLIVVSNVSPDKPASAVVALPDGASHAIDALAGRELEVVDGKVSLDIQPFRMVLIKAW